MAPDRITIDRHGMDELVLSCAGVHIERMSHDTIWIGLYLDPKTHKRVALSIRAVKNTAKVTLVENDSGAVPERIVEQP